jgi:tRNA threonylcarbamoyladenosine biosynthesis protein TsaB
MVNCIAIDASSETCSVSLVVNGKMTNAANDTPRSHAKTLLPFVHELLSLQQIAVSDLDFIACSKGPGSFTGLRIGLGVAQGLAFGAGKPMVGVSSLESMAQAASRLHPQAELVISLLDARMGELYWSVASVSSAAISSVIEPSLDGVEAVNDRLKQMMLDNKGRGVLVAGAAVELLDHASLRDLGAEVDASVAPDAATMATIAIDKWQAGNHCPPQDFQLDYLRNSVSWNKRQRIRS